MKWLCYNDSTRELHGDGMYIEPHPRLLQIHPHPYPPSANPHRPVHVIYNTIPAHPPWVVLIPNRFYRASASRVIDIAILSIRPSVRPSVCLSDGDTLVLYENGLTYRDNFFHRTVAQSF